MSISTLLLTEVFNWLVNQINKDLNAKRYCSAAFLDISQAFDKVWHSGLQVKLKKLLPHPHYQLLKSYLTDRHFLVRQGSEYTDLFPIHSGVPQGPILYLVAGQFAIIRFGRGRRPRGPTFARGTINRCSKIRNKQDNAWHLTSRRAHPAVTFFGTLISK
jgi:hypothetical protein